MAHHKSAVKRIETAERNRVRNRHFSSTLKTWIKKVRSAATKEEGEKLYRETSSILDKLAKKGIIHKNKASNQKSKLSAVVSKLN